MARSDKPRKTSTPKAGARDVGSSAIPTTPTELLASLKATLQRPTTWLGMQVHLPVQVHDLPDGVDMALWMDPQTDCILATEIGPAGTPGLLRKAFVQAMLSPISPAKPCRPRGVAIEPGSAVEQVEDLLKEIDIHLEQGADFSPMERALADFVSHTQRDYPTPLMTGLEPAEMARFCERMATLWKAAPWRHVADSEIMAVAGLTDEPVFVSILGLAKQSFGFAVFFSDLPRVPTDGEGGLAMGDVPGLVASFEDEEQVGPEWPAAVRKQRWRSGKKGLYPTAVRLGETCLIPSVEDMRLLTTLASLVAEYPFHRRAPGRLEFTIDGRDGLAVWPLPLEALAEAPEPPPSTPSPRGSAGPEAANTPGYRPGKTFQLKISLKGARPPIWRRVLVDGSTSLQDLHRVIQIAMGWGGHHLWEFEVGGEQFGDEAKNPARARLAALGLREKSSFRYVYDFGDDWQHVILVEKILPVLPEFPLPLCVGGKRAAPPDDCGGIWRFNEVVGRTAHLDKLAGMDFDDVPDVGFNPSVFDADDVNCILEAELHKKGARKA